MVNDRPPAPQATVLSLSDREALARFRAGTPLAEIAVRLGTSIADVRARLDRLILSPGQAARPGGDEGWRPAGPLAPPSPAPEPPGRGPARSPRPPLRVLVVRVAGLAAAVLLLVFGAERLAPAGGPGQAGRDMSIPLPSRVFGSSPPSVHDELDMLDSSIHAPIQCGPTAGAHPPIGIPGLFAADAERLVAACLRR